MSYTCINCNAELKKFEPAISCDTCSKWNHISCNGILSTSVTLDDYHAMLDEGTAIIWHCAVCISISAAVATIFDTTNKQCNTRVDNCLPSIREPTTSAPLYKIIKASSNKGGDILVDPDYYRFRKKIDNVCHTIRWNCRCSKVYRCLAGYLEKNGSYIPLPIHGDRHLHRCVMGNVSKKRVLAKTIKIRSTILPRRSALRVNEEATIYDEQSIVHKAPTKRALTKMINRHRQELLNTSSIDPAFDLDQSAILRGFIPHDLSINRVRWIIIIFICRTTNIKEHTRSRRLYHRYQ